MIHSSLGNKDQCCNFVLRLDYSTFKLRKSKILYFPIYGGRATTCFEIIHSDVSGIILVISHTRYRYFMTFINYYSRFTQIFFWCTKAEVLKIFLNFCNVC